MMMRQTGPARAPFSRARSTDRCRSKGEMGRRRSLGPRVASELTHDAARIGDDDALLAPAVASLGPPCAPFRSFANYIARLRTRSRSSNRSLASKATHLPTDFREDRYKLLARTAPRCCVRDRTQGETARELAIARPHMHIPFLGAPETQGAAQDGRVAPATRLPRPDASILRTAARWTPEVPPSRR